MKKKVNETSLLPGASSISRNFGNKFTQGFIYKILPLNTHLGRKPDPVTPAKQVKPEFKIGDHVQGKSLRDNKTYTGNIVRIKLIDNIKVMYILNDEDNTVIPLKYNTIRLKNIVEPSYNFNDAVQEAINKEKTLTINTINEKKSIDDMNKYVHQLILEYFDNQNTQLKDLLKSCEKEQKKYDKLSASRQEFIISILGKNTYLKYTKGDFAPIPLSALMLSYDDFAAFSLETKGNPDDERVKKLISEFRKIYYSNDVNFVNNGLKKMLQTNIVFKSFDDIINFFFNIFKIYKKVYKNEDINWSILVKKFRGYLK